MNTYGRKRSHWLALFTGLLIAGTNAIISAAEPATTVTPVLEVDAEVQATLDRLDAGESAMLPPFRVCGDLNAEAKRWKLDKLGPRTRDYCIKLAWMPDRRRAIFYGANHAVPHRLNDVWEYDLPSNTWVCLYGPDKSKHNYKEASWEDVDWDNIDEGIIRTKRGGPAIIGHSWWNMTYDPELRAMVTPCSWSMSHKKLFKLLRAGKHKPPLWAFYPEKKQWQPILDATGSLPSYENARSLEYVPELGGILWTKSKGMWLYRSKENRWKELGSARQYGSDLPPRELVTAYLPDRKMIVAHCRAGEGAPSIGFSESKTFHYLIDKNQWKMVFHGTEKGNPPSGFDAGTNFVYDPISKVCLLWDARWSQTLWSYDPEQATWSKIQFKGPPPTKGRDSHLAYFDPARNVFVINGTASGTWVYRHTKRK